jgi:hypothetical protein
MKFRTQKYTGVGAGSARCALPGRFILVPLYTRSLGQCSIQIQHSYWCKSWNQPEGLYTRSQGWHRKELFNLPRISKKCWTLWPCIGPQGKKKDTVKFGRPICNPWGQFATQKLLKMGLISGRDSRITFEQYATSIWYVCTWTIMAYHMWILWTIVSLVTPTNEAWVLNFHVRILWLLSTHENLSTTWVL